MASIEAAALKTELFREFGIQIVVLLCKLPLSSEVERIFVTALAFRLRSCPYMLKKQLVAAVSRSGRGCLPSVCGFKHYFLIWRSMGQLAARVVPGVLPWERARALQLVLLNHHH